MSEPLTPEQRDAAFAQTVRIGKCFWRVGVSPDGTVEVSAILGSKVETQRLIEALHVNAVFATIKEPTP